MSVFDRFQPPDEPQVVGQCAQCGGEIYVGDEVKRINDSRDADDGGGFVCNNFGYDCATRYAEERVYGAMGTINNRGEID